MKTVFSNSELPHQWAHQLVPYGKADSMSFNGVSFLSYSTEIARIITYNGKKAYVVNTHSYSVTTTCHQGRVRQAIPNDAKVFLIEGKFSGVDGKPLGRLLFDYAIEKASRSLDASKRARTYKDMHIADHAKWIERAGEVSEFFGLRRKVDVNVIARHAESIAREQARAFKANKERQKKLIAEQANQITEWLEGKRDYFPSGVQRIYLRKCHHSFMDGETPTVTNGVETSRGVTIPYTDAERAFRFAIARREKGWHRNGEEFKVGSYQLDAINEQGIVAGCHRLDWPTIESFAKQQGWV